MADEGAVADAHQAQLRIEICRIGIDPPERLHLTMPAGSSVRMALRESRMLEQLRVTEESLESDSAATLATQAWSVAIYGRRSRLDDTLHDHDRIELLPPVVVDPKVARQRRAAHRRLHKGERRWAPHRALPALPQSPKPAGEGGR